MPNPSDRVVVVGASAGGLDALANLLVQFDTGFPAPICVVLHVGAAASGAFAKTLHRAVPLAVSLAEDGEMLEPGRVLVAPPDHHLLIANGHVTVAHGPKENRSRPAIDPLFRSAAAVYGPGAVGVLLSGLLDDGVAGLEAICQSGGTALVQAPADADFPDLPRNALARVEVDAALPVLHLGPAIRRALSAPLDPAVHSDARIRAEAEAEVVTEATSEIAQRDALGEQVPYACPECGGPLWQAKGGVRRYRCHVGHAYTDASLAEAQAEATERALWAALRSLEERANLLADMAEDARERGHDPSVGGFEARARAAREHADQLRGVLLGDR